MEHVMAGLFGVETLVIVLRVVVGVVVADTAMAHLLPSTSFPRSLTRELTAPLYQPVRRLCDPERLGVDLSPMLVVVVLVTLGWLVAPEMVT